MGLLKNKKGVEALPLRYIIIALVAALVIGIALQFTGILKGGILNSAEEINNTLAETTICELDDDDPDISDLQITCNATSDIISIRVNVQDACGTSSVAFDINDDGLWVDLELGDGTIQDGYWEINEFNYTEGFSNGSKIEISAYDKSSGNNQGYLADVIDCD